MAKFSVKKPLTVFVVVLAVVVLGIVAYLRMTPDLLPNMDFPYVIIVTADPGASPEAVEEEITRPMEQSMATLDQIKEVTSTSQNSVSMVMLEFEDGVNMDTISVDIQQKISVLQGQWNDTVGAPYVLKINPSMIPVMVAAVSQEGKDVYALSDLVTDELTGKLEGVTGVASVTVSGALTRQAHVILDQEKMEALSAKLADAVKAQLKKAEGKLYAAKQQVEDGEKALSDAKRAAADGVAGTVGDSVDEVYKNLKELYDKLEGLDIDDLVGGFITDPDGTLKQLNDLLDTLKSSIEKLMKELESGKLEGDISDFLVQMMDGISQMTGAELQLSQAKSQIESGLKQIQEAYKKVDEQTDLGGMLSISTVSGLLTAQNFSMPAGYIDDDSGVSYMVSVGQKFENSSELEDMVLFDLGLEGVAPITLGDVATVVVTDDSDELYTKLNGENGILLSFTKQSNYATAEVSNNITARFETLEAQYEGLTFVPLMDQGDYIYLIVETILSSLLWGAVFSVVVLFLFLRDWRPTLITLISIPVSVIFAVVLMYFTGVTINMISLSGLAVSVGMLVDNSVVVIENIYRLRAKGATIIQAAVSGAGQVLGAVTASTLTTVCVFAPIVFVEGLTRQLFTDLALTITYSLLASLLVSLTLVPAMASGMLRREFTFMPEIDMNNLSVTVTMPEGTTRDEAVALADQVMERVMSVDNIDAAGFMMGSGDMGGLSMASGDNGEFDVTGYLTMPEGTFGSDAGKEIEALCADLPCKVTTAGVMSGMMSYMTGTGVSLRVYGSDMESLQGAARSLGQRMEQVEGVQDVSDGLEDAAPALQVVVDRNKAMTKGITVAQIYMQVAAALQDTTTVAEVTLDGESMEMIVDAAAGSKLTREKLMDLTISPDSSAMSSSMSSMSGMDSSMSSSMASMGGMSGMSSSSASGLSQLTGEDSGDEDTSFKLGEVAEVKETVSLNSIQRDQQRRCITVSAAVADGYNVTKVTTAVQKALGSVTLPEGVTVEFDGENEQIMNAIQQLLLMLLLGVVLVYLIMVAQFQSLKAPFIVMFTIPLAFTGGFLALLISGIEVSVISLIGFVMLVGIIVNNGIVLVDYINQQRLAGMGLREAIIDAGVTRLRPILMTSLTTILGLIVTALAKNAGTALIQPIALVCIGGLLYATLMTLFVVPCMYEILSKKELRQVSEDELKLLDM